MGKIKIGCTLFCFSTPYIKGELSLEDCVRTAARIGAEGFEIVATQMISSYPYVSDKVAGEFERFAQLYGIRPVCYAANMDRGLRFDRDLSNDEMFSMALNDIRNAHLLGCTIMREQILTPPEVMVRLAPYAEEYGVKIGIEVHNPETPTSELIMGYREAFEKCGSKYLGFIVDCGCFATKPNKPHWDRALANGAPLELLEMAKQMRYDEVPLDKAYERLAKAGANDAVFAALQGMYAFVQFRKQVDMEGLKGIIPYTFEFHGKCHYISEDLKEASIPYEEIIPVIKNSDFDGYIMTEYEDEGKYDSVEMTKRHIAMERALISKC